MPYPSQIDRGLIIETARRMIEAKGVDNVSLNAIAREAGLSKPNLYRYYESREAILLALLIEEHRSWVHALSNRLSEAGVEGDVEFVADSFARGMWTRNYGGASLPRPFPTAVLTERLMFCIT